MLFAGPIDFEIPTELLLLGLVGFVAVYITAVYFLSVIVAYSFSVITSRYFSKSVLAKGLYLPNGRFRLTICFMGIGIPLGALLFGLIFRHLYANNPGTLVYASFPVCAIVSTTSIGIVVFRWLTRRKLEKPILADKARTEHQLRYEPLYLPVVMSV